MLRSWLQRSAGVAARPPFISNACLWPSRASLRLSQTSTFRLNSGVPQSSDSQNDLRANDMRSRLPKFPLHKDVIPSLIPKADTPRVGKDMTFSQLISRLKSSKGPELVYMAESHRLYFLACLALAFVTAYNLFDILELAVPLMIKSYQENDLDGTPMENAGQLVRRFGMVGVMSAIYLAAGLILVTIPTRLVRRIEYVPGPQELVRLVTHPLLPGRPSPVITMPLANVSIGKRTKVWTGDGFYGTASKSSFFFLLWEEGRRIPWIVDRSGWFWGDGRVYDVIFGKEPVALAEKGVSYDDMLRQQMLKAEQRKAELRRELGPAWRVKATGQLMKEDIQRFSGRGRAAVMATLDKSKPRQRERQIGSGEPKDEKDAQ